eukprot:8675164-Pyramimonas_sp.AAC.1
MRLSSLLPKFYPSLRMRFVGSERLTRPKVAVVRGRPGTSGGVLIWACSVGFAGWCVIDPIGPCL